MANRGRVPALLCFALAVAGLLVANAPARAKSDKKGDREATKGPLSRDGAIAALVQSLGRVTPAGQPMKLAVLDLTDLNGNCSALGRFVAEELTTELAVHSGFEVIERNRLLQVLADLAQFAAPDPETYSVIQQSLGVEYVVVGTLTPLDETIKVNARLIATNTGRIIASASAEFVSDKPMKRLLETRCSDAGKRASGSSGPRVTGQPPMPQPALIKAATADSWEPGSPPQYAIDGRIDTMWHTEWASRKPPYPHALVLELVAAQEVVGLKYVPRQDHPNGRLRLFEIYVSDDGKDWGEAVSRGMWVDDVTAKTVEFEAKRGRYVRLRGLAERAGNLWMSAAEVEVMAYPPD